MKEKYFLKIIGIDNESEVTKEQWVKAERAAGFWPKGEDRGQPATAGFSGGSISGRIEYVDDDIQVDPARFLDDNSYRNDIFEDRDYDWEDR